MPHASPDTSAMGAVLAAVRRRAPRLLMWSVVAGGAAFACLGLVAPRYQSQAELAVSPPVAADAGSVGDVTATDAHVRALLSPERGRRIAAEQKLAERAEFNPARGAPDTLGRLLRLVDASRRAEITEAGLLARFYERLSITPRADGRTIVVRFTSTDPVLSAAVANSLAEDYRRSQADQARQATEARQAIDAKIEAQRRAADAASAAVAAVRSQSQSGAGAPPANNEKLIGDLTADLSRAEGAQREADKRLAEARAMMIAGTGDAIPNARPSALMKEAVQKRGHLERQIAELSVKLLPGHPRMQQLNNDLAGLKTQIAGEAAKIVETLDQEAKVAALRVAEIARKLESFKVPVVDTAVLDARLRQLETQAQAKQAELARLESEKAADRVAAGSLGVPAEVRTVNAASPASDPAFPRKERFAALAAVTTLVLGLAITIARALLGARRVPVAVQHVPPPIPVRAGGASARRADPVLSTPAPPPPLMQPVVIVPPEAMPPDRPAREAARDPYVAPVEPMLNAESDVVRVGTIGALARRIASRTSSGGYRTLVAGETEFLGVSSHATELARALTDLGQSVILIDWSPEGDGIAEAAGLPASAGIADLLDGAATFEDVVRRLPGSEAHLIGAGSFEADPVARPDPDRLNLVLDALDEAYDQIIIAGRHVLARNFFETIEGRVDCGVLIADPGRMNSGPTDRPGRYLGFEVADIDLVRYDRQQAANAPAQRVARPGRPQEPVSRTG